MRLHLHLHKSFQKALLRGQEIKIQALEANALYFKTDIWSSSVVILSLVSVTLGPFLPKLDWMHQADLIARLIVALIVIFVSAELGWRTIAALLDSAPQGMVEKIEQAAASIDGVVNAHAIRIRPSSAIWFIEMHVTMNGSTHLSRAPTVTEMIERKVQGIIPGTDITVHVEPEE